MNGKRSEVLGLMATFRKDGERAQHEAIEQLKDYAGEAVPLLKEALQSSRSAHVRAWSATALGVLERGAAMADLVTALADPAMSVRLHAIQALVDFGDTKVAQAIVPLVRDPSGGVRVNAIEGITKLRLTGAGHEIMARASDEKWYVRQRVARAIAMLNIVNGLPVLHSLSNDPHKAVSNEAKRSLEAMQAKTVVAPNVPAR